jgi:hypothetical protein
MKKRYEWGMIYANKYGETVKIIDNLREAPKDWILCFYYKDRNENIFLEHMKGRKLCIEINPHYISPEGALYSEMLTIAGELRENGKRKIASSIEKIVQDNIKSRMWDKA